MILWVKGHILKKPVGRNKGLRHLLVWKLHLRNHQRRKGRFKHIQLYGEGRDSSGRYIVPDKSGTVNRKEIAFFGYDIAVCLGSQMLIGFFVQGKVVFIPDKEAFSLDRKSVV